MLSNAVAECYVKALVDGHRLPASSAADTFTRLKNTIQAFSSGRGAAIVPPEAVSAAVLSLGQHAHVGGGGSGGGGGGFRSGAGMGLSGGLSYPNNLAPASLFGNAAGSTAAGGAGSVANPIIVELAPSKSTTSDRLVAFFKIAQFALAVGIVWMVYNAKIPSPLASLTGDIADEVDVVPTTRFADVRGCDESKAELQDVVEFLRNPERYKRLGAKVPCGVLLTGPPGTGKTLLARAVAGEAGCKFYAKSASEFEEMLVGLGAKRVRELFSGAKKNAPAIIFIDEIDAMGSKRGVSMSDSNSGRQTLNQLLSCMDGFSKNEGVIVIGATNSPGMLDPALVRPGRFDTTVDVPLPDVKGRREIIDLYLTKIVAASDIDADHVARATPGFSGAQLEALVNSAALMAAKRDSDAVELSDIEEARDKLIMGPAKLSRVRTAEMSRLVAYHEGGHTLTAMLTRGTAKLHKVTILPRGGSGGATFSLPDDTGLHTRESYLATIDVCMGGRVAEELTFGAEKVTDGASSDMQQASSIARSFCAAFSMAEGLSFFGNNRDWAASPERHAQLDVEVEKILRASYERVTALLLAHKADLDRLAHALVSIYIFAYWKGEAQNFN